MDLSFSSCCTDTYVINLPVFHVSVMGHPQLSDPARCQDFKPKPLLGRCESCVQEEALYRSITDIGSVTGDARALAILRQLTLINVDP